MKDLVQNLQNYDWFRLVPVFIFLTFLIVFICYHKIKSIEKTVSQTGNSDIDFIAASLISSQTTVEVYVNSRTGGNQNVLVDGEGPFIRSLNSSKMWTQPAGSTLKSLVATSFHPGGYTPSSNNEDCNWGVSAGTFNINNNINPSQEPYYDDISPFNVSALGTGLGPTYGFYANMPLLNPYAESARPLYFYVIPSESVTVAGTITFQIQYQGVFE